MLNPGNAGPWEFVHRNHWRRLKTIEMKECATEAWVKELVTGWEKVPLLFKQIFPQIDQYEESSSLQVACPNYKLQLTNVEFILFIIPGGHCSRGLPFPGVLSVIQASLIIHKG